MSSLVSVVIPAYNCAEYIGATLESVLAQSHRPIEVIVVDDGSTDGTDAVVRGFREAVYIRQPNGGPAMARNVGIRRATGPYVAFQDADDLWTPEKLSRQLAIMESDPQIGLVFGDMKNFSGVEDHEPTMFEKYRLGEPFFGHAYLVLGAVEKLVRMNFMPTGTVIARKAVLSSVGLFDESLRRAEDWDLWLRIALRYRIGYTSQVVMLRRLHHFNVSKESEAMSIAALQVLEKLKINDSDALSRVSANVGAQLRNGYRNLGYFYLRQFALKKARGALMRSLAFGVDGRALLYLASTFLGVGFVKSVIRARG
jgi:glycosyltransferase involved in cell wall biosynthesis